MTYDISIYLNSSCELLGGLGRPNGKGLPANAKSPRRATGDRWPWDGLEPQRQRRGAVRLGYSVPPKDARNLAFASPALKQKARTPTVSKVIETLVELDIAREITGRWRNRLLTYDADLAILSEGTEPH